MVQRRIRPIIVIGPERSGTSAWAEMITSWGAYPGQAEDLPAPDELNPRGRWEYQPLWDLLETVGDFAEGVSWWEESFADRVAVKADNPDLLEAAFDLVGQMERQGLPWVWKDPALCHFLPFWRRVWHDPLYLIAVRNPLDVARSWQQFSVLNGRRPTSVTCNLLRWQHMVLSAVRETDQACARVFVEYEALVQNPLRQARRLAGVLDDQCGGTSDETRIATMAATCDPALWRFRAPARPDADTKDALTPAQTALYELMRNRAADLDSPLADSYPMPDGWRTLVIAEESAAWTGS